MLNRLRKGKRPKRQEYNYTKITCKNNFSLLPVYHTNENARVNYTLYPNKRKIRMAQKLP